MQAKIATEYLTMKFRLIYPRWPKLTGQNEFHLPPHGPVVFAVALPEDVEVEFIDENLEMICSERSHNSPRGLWIKRPFFL